MNVRNNYDNYSATFVITNATETAG